MDWYMNYNYVCYKSNSSYYAKSTLTQLPFGHDTKLNIFGPDWLGWLSDKSKKAIMNQMSKSFWVKTI